MSRKSAEGRQFIIYNSYYVILDDITTFFSNQKRPKVKVGSNSLVASLTADRCCHRRCCRCAAPLTLAIAAESAVATMVTFVLMLLELTLVVADFVHYVLVL